MKLLNTSLKKLTFGLASLLISTSFTTTAMAAGNAANGEKLFTESKCDKCHGTEVFTRKDRKVTSIAKLEAQVRRCDSNLNTNWFDEDVADVTAYLNKRYYKFK